MQHHTGTVNPLQSGEFPQRKHCTGAVTSTPVPLPVRLVQAGILVTHTTLSLGAVPHCWVSPGQKPLYFKSNVCHLPGWSSIWTVPMLPLSHYRATTETSKDVCLYITQCGCASSLRESSFILFKNYLFDLHRDLILLGKMYCGKQ